MKSTNNKFNGLLYKVLLGAFTSVIICGLFLYYFFLAPNIIQTKRIYLHAGSTYPTILSYLKENKLTNSTFTFDVASTILRLKPKIKRGSYTLNQGMNNWQAVNLLKKGLQKPVKFTISYAVDKQDFVEQVCDKLDIKPQELHNALCDSEMLKKYGFNSDNVLTLFIPNTYELYWTISSKDFIQKMYTEYKSFWNEDRIQKAKDLKLSPIEVSILASIVQSETNKLDEATTIAGVYVNRLKKKIPLCSCPTIKHILKDKKIRRILKKDTFIDSAYNTYRKAGLPPGPLCMPNIAYIDAVLKHEKHTFLYFSIREDLSGYHFFAKTLQDHNNNARKYRKTLNNNKIFR